jgi:hypothetical protein
MTWKSLDEDILAMFDDAAATRGHVRRAASQSAAPVRAFEFGELQAARFGLRTSKRARAAEAREMTRYYMRKWKAAMRADPANAARYRENARAYARKGWQQIKADPTRHAERCARKRADYAKNRDAIRERANAAATPERRHRWRESRLEKLAKDDGVRAKERELSKARRERWYAALKADPVRYAAYLARCAAGNNRRYHAKQARAVRTEAA